MLQSLGIYYINEQIIQLGITLINYKRTYFIFNQWVYNNNYYEGLVPNPDLHNDNLIRWIRSGKNGLFTITISLI